MTNYKIKKIQSLFDEDELIQEIEVYNIEKKMRGIIYTNLDMELKDLKEMIEEIEKLKESNAF